HLTDRASTCHRYAFVTLAKHEVSDRNAPPVFPRLRAGAVCLFAQDVSARVCQSLLDLDHGECAAARWTNVLWCVADARTEQRSAEGGRCRDDAHFSRLV